VKKVRPYRVSHVPARLSGPVVVDRVSQMGSAFLRQTTVSPEAIWPRDQRDSDGLGAKKIPPRRAPYQHKQLCRNIVDAIRAESGQDA